MTPPLDPRIQLRKALAAYGVGDLDVAVGLVRELLTAHPRDVQAHFAMGMICAAAGDALSAIGWMREALRLEPRFGPAIERLAVLYMEVGDYASAEKFAHRVLLSDPNNFEGLTVLAQCFEGKGQDMEALVQFGKASLARPHEAEPHLGAARVCKKQFLLEGSLAHLREASRLSPTLETLIELAELQALAGMREQSVATLQQAAENSPNSFEANVLLARALVGQDEAQRYWHNAEKLESMPGQARLAKALALSLAGDFSAAQEEALISLQRNPKRGKPYFIHFSSKRATPDDQPLIEKMESLVAASETGVSDRVDLHYALGKTYDNLGEYGAAVGHFDAANNLLRGSRSGPFDREAFRRSVDNQIHTFTKAKLSEEGETDLPLFVTGMLRSGTTLIDQILSSHPEVGSAGELGYWPYYELASIDYDRKSVRPEATTFTERYRLLLTLLVPGKRHVIDKNPANMLVAGLIHSVFPGSRIVCARRNAVDTALSIWMTQMQTNAPFVFDKSDIVFAYKEFLRLADHWKQAMPPNRYMEIRYEELIAEPEAQTRSLVQFCGLSWDEACLRPQDSSQPVRTPSFWQVRQPIYKTSVDRWRNYEPWLGPFEELVGL